MTVDAQFFPSTDYAVFENGLVANAEYDGERERIRNKLTLLHKSIYPEIRKRKWDLHPHWMPQWLISASRISPATARIEFMTLRYSKPETTIKLMKKTAYLLNASRGPVVEEAALVQSPKEGWIAGAGLDVYEHEPAVHRERLGLPNVVLAPHIASASHDTRIQMGNLAVENCLAVLEGRTPPTPVNPEALKRR